MDSRLRNLSVLSLTVLEGDKMGEFASIVNTWLANRRTRQTIRNIEKNNEIRGEKKEKRF